jgi:hypothetical protein
MNVNLNARSFVMGTRAWLMLTVVGATGGVWAGGQDMPDYNPAQQQDTIGDNTRYVDQPQYRPEPEGRTLRGEVVHVGEERLWLSHMGAVVPFRLSKQTKVTDGLAVDALKPGWEVRATFEVDGVENQVRRIEVLPAAP